MTTLKVVNESVTAGNNCSDGKYDGIENNQLINRPLINQSFNQPINESTNQTTDQSPNLSINYSDRPTH